MRYEDKESPQNLEIRAHCAVTRTFPPLSILPSY